MGKQRTTLDTKGVLYGTSGDPRPHRARTEELSVSAVSVAHKSSLHGASGNAKLCACRGRVVVGGGAANSVLVGVDPLAIDCVQLDLINRERAERALPQTTHPILDACAEAGLGIQEHSATHAYTRIDYRIIGSPTPADAPTWAR